MDRFGHTILDVLPHPPLHAMWWLTGYRDLFWCSFDTNSGFLYTFHSKIHQLLQTLKTMFFKIQIKKIEEEKEKRKKEKNQWIAHF